MGVCAVLRMTCFRFITTEHKWDVYMFLFASVYIYSWFFLWFIAFYSGCNQLTLGTSSYNTDFIKKFVLHPIFMLGTSNFIANPNLCDL
jgi:hypothetical protein